MEKIKAFLYVYKKSLSSLPYYRELLSINTKFSFKYFVVLAVLATFITTLRIAVPLIPEVKTQAEILISELSNIYPEELVIESRGGEWEINQEEPYFIETPELLRTEEAAGLPANLFVFYHQGTLNDLENLDTMALINDVNIIVRGDLNKTEVYPLDDLPEGQFSKDKYDYMVDKIRGYVKYISPVLFTFIMLGTFFYYFVYRIFYLVFVAVLLYILGAIKNVKAEPSAYYRIAMHTFTLPLTLEVLFAVLGIGIGFPLWFFAVNVVFGGFVLLSLDSNTPEVPAE